MPIPKPNEGESKDDFIGRCMANPKMNSEYPDNKQRAAVCNGAFSAGGEGVNLTEEIFAVGKWNGLDFTLEDLKLMVTAFEALKEVHQIPLANLKLGHNDEQPLTDGQPALGWVESVFIEGNKLMAKFVDVPTIVAEAIKKKLYRNKSVELDMGVEHKGNYYPWVLSGVALLGADIPAVNTLNDLGAYMDRRDAVSFKSRAFFTKDVSNGKNHRSKSMDTEEVVKLKEELATLKMQFNAMNVENEKLVGENMALKKQDIERRAEFKVWEESEKVRKQKEERSTLEAQLEQMVKEGKIAPFNRDDYLRDYDEANDELKKTVVFSVDKLQKTIDSSPSFFGAQQARSADERARDEADKDASAIVTARTRELMAKNGEKNFAVAKQTVLKADPELAARYVKGEG